MYPTSIAQLREQLASGDRIVVDLTTAPEYASFGDDLPYVTNLVRSRAAVAIDKKRLRLRSRRDGTELSLWTEKKEEGR